MGNGPKPDWYDDYMACVWVPTQSSQLRHLQRTLNPHIALYTKTYLPIRNNVYAHHLMTDETVGADLFPNTDRNELGKSIDFLQDLVHVIENLYDNGREPVLGNRDLTQDKKVARHSVEKVLRRLVGVSR